MGVSFGDTVHPMLCLPGIALEHCAREPNADHRRPPRAYVGSGGAIGEFQLDTSVGGFAEVSLALPDGSVSERRSFQALDGATGDVSGVFFTNSVTPSDSVLLI